MKKILILAGGSGPAQLLSGLHEHKIMQNAKVQVLINGLDNGLSTGQCRQIFGGKLLGPSDVRKNALTRYVQKHGNTELHKLLNLRFNCTSDDAENFVFSAISAADLSNPQEAFLIFATNEFFKQPLAKTIDYNDFSLSNLIYSGVAAQNGLSLYKASQIIAKELLDIEEDFVLLNSDESVFINAVTASGKVLTDEVDIDEWDHIEDRIESIFFTDPTGKRIPAPDLHPDAVQAIKNADIIIYSSGTQWTSLIPTYASNGFLQALSESSAKQYLVMNNIADTDMTGMTSADVVDLLRNYLPIPDITVILNLEAHSDMQMISESPMKFIKTRLSDPLSKTHKGSALVQCIFNDYFNEEINLIKSKAALLLDYDDTIVGRNGSFKKQSEFNLHAINSISTHVTNNISIVTGNSIRAINSSIVPGLHVFADNSCNEYLLVPTDNNVQTSRMRYKSLDVIDKKFSFSQDEVTKITEVITGEVGIDISKITNKGFAGVGIKPLVAEYRQAIAKLIKLLIDPTDEIYEVLVSGRTTIDIYKKGVSKMNVVNKFLNDGMSVVFMGDEWKKGNDADVFKASQTNDKLNFVKVEDPADTALFFTVLLFGKMY